MSIRPGATHDHIRRPASLAVQELLTEVERGRPDLHRRNRRQQDPQASLQPILRFRRVPHPVEVADRQIGAGPTSQANFAVLHHSLVDLSDVRIVLGLFERLTCNLKL